MLSHLRAKPQKLSRSDDGESENEYDEPEDNAPKEASRPLKNARVHVPADPAPDTTFTRAESTSSDETIVAGQRPSVWSTYNTRAQRYDEKLLNSWAASMDVLLVFAALFTAIVTSFVIDSMHGLDGETTTDQLLRALISQQYPNATSIVPPSETPTYVYTVNILWFTSILCTLFASTGAMLCKEWCTQYLNREDPTDLTEHACNRQYAFDAVNNWHMGSVAVFIPTILHMSIFLFLIGLWQSLSHKSHALGVVIGLATVVLVLFYVFLTLLPVFANAPFNTSTTAIIINARRVAGDLKTRHLSRLEPPPIYYKLMSFFPQAPNVPIAEGIMKGTQASKQRMMSTSTSTRLYVHEVINFQPYHLNYPLLSSVARTTFKSTHALIKFILSFKPKMKPLTPKNVVPIEIPLNSRINVQTEVRALLWMFHMPLKLRDTEEMLGILHDKAMDHPECLSSILTHVPLLTLCMRSVLEKKVIHQEKVSIARSCLLTLARIRDHFLLEFQEADSVVPMDEMVEDVVNALVSVVYDPSKRRSQNIADLEKVAAAMFVCPSQSRAVDIVNRLEDHFSGICTLEERIVIKFIRSLHALYRLSRNTEHVASIPRFSFWVRESTSPLPSLQILRTLLLYLTDLMTLRPFSPSLVTNNIGTSAIIVQLLRALDAQQTTEQVQTCRWVFSVIRHLWLTEPSWINEWVGVALLRSAQVQGEVARVLLPTKMHTIANGPKVLHDNIVRPLTTLADIYVRVMDASVDDTPSDTYSCTIHAYAATLHQAFVRGKQNVSLTSDIESSSVYLMRHIRTHQVQERHETILPSVYALSIAYCLCPAMSEKVEWSFWSDLLLDSTRLLNVGEEAVAEELDSKMHIALVLDRCSQRLARRANVCYDLSSRGGVLLSLLMDVILNNRNSPQLMWKALYVFMAISRFFSRDELRIKGGILADFEQRMTEGEPFVDPGWENMRDDFRKFGIDTVLEGIPSSMVFVESVFDWRNGFPLLRLYPAQMQPVKEDTRFMLAEEDDLCESPLSGVFTELPPPEFSTTGAAANPA